MQSWLQLVIITNLTFAKLLYTHNNITHWSPNAHTGVTLATRFHRQYEYELLAMNEFMLFASFVVLLHITDFRIIDAEHLKIGNNIFNLD